MKTIEEWLQELPEKYRGKAIKNMLPSRRNKKVDNPVKALMSAFYWSATIEKHLFWEKCMFEIIDLQ